MFTACHLLISQFNHVERLDYEHKEFQLIHRYLHFKPKHNTFSHKPTSSFQIKTWFQNRRMKEKRQVKDGGDQHLMATPPCALTPHLMTSQALPPHIAYPGLPSSPSLLPLVSASPPTMHRHSPVPGVSHHDMFGGAVGAAYPGFHAAHHVIPAPMTSLPVHQHPYAMHYGTDYNNLRAAAFNMALPVMLQ